MHRPCTCLAPPCTERVLTSRARASLGGRLFELTLTLALTLSLTLALTPSRFFERYVNLSEALSFAGGSPTFAPGKTLTLALALALILTSW